MPVPQPRLPPELVDAVIDELVTNKAALSSVSLVARNWRYRANPHRFTQLSFWPTENGEDQISRHANILKALLDADAVVWQQRERIVQHFDYIGLPVEKTTWREAALFEISPCISDGTMASVLRTVFQKDDLAQATRPERKLELITTDLGMGPLDFDELNTDFKNAIYEVCSNGSVTCLALLGFENVPVSLLSSLSTIRVLDLHDIILALPSPLLSSPSPTLQNLEEIEFRNCPSFLQFVSHSPEGTLPALRRIGFFLDHSWSDNADDISDIIQSRAAKQITNLSVCVPVAVDITEPLMHFSSLTSLRTLEIACHARLGFNPEDEEENEQLPCCLTLHNLLPHHVPPITMLKIHLHCEYRAQIPHTSLEIVELFRRRLHHPSLFVALEQAAQDPGTRFQITVYPRFLYEVRDEPDFDILSKQYHALIQDEFSELKRISGVDFVVDFMMC